MAASGGGGIGSRLDFAQATRRRACRTLSVGLPTSTHKTGAMQGGAVSAARGRRACHLSIRVWSIHHPLCRAFDLQRRHERVCPAFGVRCGPPGACSAVYLRNSRAAALAAAAEAPKVQCKYQMTR